MGDGFLPYDRDQLLLLVNGVRTLESNSPEPHLVKRRTTIITNCGMDPEMGAWGCSGGGSYFSGYVYLNTGSSPFIPVLRQLASDLRTIVQNMKQCGLFWSGIMGKCRYEDALTLVGDNELREDEVATGKD